MSVTDTLAYHGGPVLRAHATYAIYWQDPSASAFPSDFMTGVDRYFQDVAAASGTATNEYSVLTQYRDSTGAGAYASTFGASYVDTSPYPAYDPTGGCAPPGTLPAGYTSCLSDAQIQAELQRLISAHGWPSGSSAAYFVFLPSGVDECFTGAGANLPATICADGTGQGFCSYHSYYSDHGQSALYGVMPWADVPGCQVGASPNGTGGDDPLDDQVNLISHEHAEMITDPFLSGWYVTSQSPANGYEVADLCAAPYQFGALAGLPPSQYNETIAGDNYLLQENFSNDGAACRARYLARFSMPSKSYVNQPTLFNAQPSTAISSFVWNFGDGSAPYVVNGSDQLVTHTYAQAGTYTVTLTTLDGDNTTDSVSETLAVATPLAKFTAPAQAQAGTAISFNGSSSQDAATWTWDFGDGTSASGKLVSHAFATAGSYLVTLTVRDGLGDASSASQTVNVGAAPSPTVVSPQSPSGGSTDGSGGSSATPSAGPDQGSTSGANDAQTPPVAPATPTVVAAPAPTPPAKPLAHADIAAAARPSVVTRGGRTVAYTGEMLSCPRGVSHCVASVTLIHVATHPGSPTLLAHHSAALKLGATRIVTPAGDRVEIALQLTAAAVRLLHSAGHLRADLEIVANVVGGAATTRVLPITLSAPA